MSDIDKQIDEILKQASDQAWNYADAKKFGDPFHKARQAIKHLILQERIKESNLWFDEWGNGTEQIGDGSWEEYHDYRIKELKSQLGDSDE